MSIASNSTARSSATSAGLAALGYAALIAYGSLYPFTGATPDPHPFAFLARGWTGTQTSLGDLGTNLLAYMPLGLLIYRCVSGTSRKVHAAGLAIGLAFALSLAMEVLQAFVPTRVQSYLDLAMNTLGGAIGAALARVSSGDGWIPDRIRRVRTEWLAAGRLTDLGLFALAAWALSRLMPLVPTIDVGKIRFALAPLARTVSDPRSFNGWYALAETLTWAGFALIGRSLVRRGKPGSTFFAVVAACLLAAQLPIVGRQLLPEVVVGCGAGLLLALLVGWVNAATRANIAFFLLFSGFCVAESLVSSAGGLHPFNWVPFSSKLVNTVAGIESLLEIVGLAAAFAWSIRAGTGRNTVRGLGWLAGLVAAGGAFALELGQRHVPGRSGDITTPLLVIVTWIAAWRFVGPVAAMDSPVESAASGVPVERTAPVPRSRHGLSRSRVGIVRHYALAVLVLSIVVWGIGHVPGVPYNVRELLYAGHPFRSAVLLSLALFLTLCVPVWLVVSYVRHPAPLVRLPAALVLNALLTWITVVNAVASESIHDIVGSPILGWGGTETCLRFIALHSAITLLATGGAIVALVVLQPQRARLLLRWALASVVLGPLLHWVIVSKAATDNLTELMRDGGSPMATVLLGLAGLVGFASGSLISASIALARRRKAAISLALLFSVLAYVLVVAGTDPAIVKYGKTFSALQFLLSADRTHYAGPAELVARYSIAYGLLAATIALLQYRAWVAVGVALPRHEPNAQRHTVDAQPRERS